MKRDGHGRAGKSLVELLVALAIIALMLCMLLPAVLQAFKAALSLGA